MSTSGTKFQESAIKIATSICRDAIWSGNKCNWIGSSSEDFYGAPKGFARALGAGFYDGLAGVSWFLMNVTLSANKPLVEKTARGSLNLLASFALEAAKKNIDQTGKLGFYTGFTGIAYVLTVAGKMFNEPHYRQAAESLTRKIFSIPAEYRGLDMIEGAAGAIPALISLYIEQPDELLHKFILSLGDFLIEKADRKDAGWSWNTMDGSTCHLTGLGHGASGFANAFTELYAFTHNSQYLEIAELSVKYENGHFNTSQQNWPDFRQFNQPFLTSPDNDEPPCSMAWCHGAPGIGLARLKMFELTGNDLYRQDAEIALQTTIDHLSLYQTGNYSMCHGIFGNAELLLAAAEMLDKPALLKLIEDKANECIDNFLSKGIPIPNGLQTGNETPDFMLGSSGIGYFFLRLTDPKKFPSMLLIRQRKVLDENIMTLPAEAQPMHHFLSTD